MTHVPGKLEVKALGPHSFVINSLDLCAGIAKTQVYPGAEAADIRATAERLVVCWNNYNALVAALTEIGNLEPPFSNDGEHDMLVDAIATANAALRAAGEIS